MTLAPRLLLAGLCLATGVAAQDEPRVTGRFFEVRGHGVTREVAAQALSTVEPVWPAVCDFFGVPATPPSVPLAVHLYRDADGYRAADRRLTGGRFGPNQAMSHWRTKSSHVAVQPPCDDKLLAARGLPMQTRAMLAWEACHIVRYELCPNFRLHPGWFFDGLAAAVARRVMTAADAAPQPFFSQRWLRARRLAKEGDLPGVRQLLTDETQDLQMRDRYAARIAFFAFAEERAPEALRRLATKIRGTAASTTYAGTVAAAAVTELGGLEQAFHRFAVEAAPAWDEQVRSLWRVGDGWRQQAFAAADAIALRTVQAPRAGFGARGEVRIEPHGPMEMRLLFAWGAGGGYALSMTAGKGVKLLSVAANGSARAELAAARCDGLRPGAWCRFALSVADGSVYAQVAGHKLEAALPEPMPEQVCWGLSACGGGAGAAVGSVGVWRDLVAEPR
ncbi:MAG: hypothetical protein VYA51_09700 [Planctomycetota bacterium]|nr:hypothetical protein [Planctomycetota bacterium]MEC9048275.1 hypothetical protein [Planctomycetota bacterium]